MSNLKQKWVAQAGRDSLQRASQFASGWIEASLKGEAPSVPEVFATRVVQRLRALQLVPALAGTQDHPAFQEAYRREVLRRSAAAEELGILTDALLAAQLPVLLGGELALYLSVSPQEGDALMVPEIQVWTREHELIDSLSALGKAGYRVSQAYQRAELSGSVPLRRRPGAPRVRVVRFRVDSDRTAVVPEIWGNAISGGLRGLPESAFRLNATENLVELMRDFAGFPHSAVRSLVSARALLGSSLRAELDWVRLTKTLARTGDLGRAIAGFRVLSQEWGVELESPLRDLVASRSKGLAGEVLRNLFSVQAFVRGSVSPIRRLVGKWTALRPALRE